MEQDDIIPISLVGQYVYCPRRAWLEAQGERVESYQMQVGFSHHARVDSGKPTTGDEHCSVDLKSERLGLSGKADLIKAQGDGMLLREYKATPVRKKAVVVDGTKIQLALQRLCLEEMGNVVVGAEVYFTNHNMTIPVELDEQLLKRAEGAVLSTRELVQQSDKAPQALEDDHRCVYCSHVDVCLPDEKYLRPVKRSIQPRRNDKKVIELVSQGSYAHVRKGRMLIESEGEPVGDVPLETVQAVRAMGTINMSGGLIKELLRRDIPIQWCTASGNLVGWAVSSMGPNGSTRQLQHIRSHDGCLPLAKEFISSKIANQATQLRRSGVDPSVTRDLRDYQHLCGNVHDLKELFGLEGRAAAVYFRNWPFLIKEGQRELWAWNGRSGRPATDPINSMLNYVYSMLVGDEVSSILACGLDPNAGFLHSSNRNKPALALDLMEEVRAPIGDSVVQTLINCQMIQPSDFSNELGSVRMNRKARQALVGAYERRMATEFIHPIFGYRVTWRRALEIQARQILGYLEHSQPAYQGIRIR